LTNSKDVVARAFFPKQSPLKPTNAVIGIVSRRSTVRFPDFAKAMEEEESIMMARKASFIGGDAN